MEKVLYNYNIQNIILLYFELETDLNDDLTIGQLAILS